MDGSYYMFNSGAILRRLFPKQLKTTTLICIWAFIFIMNIVIVVLIQNLGIYTIDDFTKESLQQNTYFSGSNIQSVDQLAQQGDKPAGYCILYQNANGENRVVCLDTFPVSIIKRAHLDKSTDALVNADGTVQIKTGNETTNISMRDYLLSTQHTDFLTNLFITYGPQALVVSYIAIASGMLLIEFMLYGIFVKLFR